MQDAYSPLPTSPIYTDKMEIKHLVFDTEKNVLIRGSYHDLAEGGMHSFQAFLYFEDYLRLFKDVPDPNDVLLPCFKEDESLCVNILHELQEEPLVLRGVLVMNWVPPARNSSNPLFKIFRPSKVSDQAVRDMPCLTISDYREFPTGVMVPYVDERKHKTGNTEMLKLANHLTQKHLEYLYQYFRIMDDFEM